MSRDTTTHDSNGRRARVAAATLAVALLAGGCWGISQGPDPVDPDGDLDVATPDIDVSPGDTSDATDVRTDTVSDAGDTGPSDTDVPDDTTPSDVGDTASPPPDASPDTRPDTSRPPDTGHRDGAGDGSAAPDGDAASP